MSIDLRLGAPGDAHALTALAADADAGGLAFLGVEQHHVGDVDRAFLLDHAADGLGALGAAHLLGPLVALDEVEALDVHAPFLRVDAQDLAGLAAILPRDDHDLVVAADLRSHQSTSGASETIFMKFRSRSSRATGPKIRVPSGLLPSSIRTAAFSSNEM